MEQRDDDELLLTTKETWGGGPLSFEELQAMVREGVEAPSVSSEDVDAHTEDLLA